MTTSERERGASHGVYVMHWEKLKAGKTDIDFLLCIRNIVILGIRKAIKGGFLRYQELLLIDASSLFLVGNSLVS